MKIMRDGTEYELTSYELYMAYKEQEHLTDTKDIENNMETYLSEADFHKLENNVNFISEAAYKLRVNLNECEMNFDDAVSNAIKTVKADYLKS